MSRLSRVNVNMVKCAVSSCRNRSRPADPKVLRGPPKRFFRFPEDPERVQVWMAALREMDDLDPTELSICEDHFLPQDITHQGVKGDAVPIMPQTVDGSMDTMDSWMFDEEYEWDLGSDGVEGGVIGGEGRPKPAAVNPGTEFPDKKQIKKPSLKKPRRPKATDSQREPLAKRLLEKLLEAPNNTLDLCHMTVALETHRNRLWEISTVLEGINLVEKVARNKIRWLGRGSSVKLSLLQKEVTDLKTMEETLDRLLTHFSQQLLILTSDRVNAALAYVTLEDLSRLEAFQQQTVMVVRAPDETRMKVQAAPEDLIQVHLKGGGGPTEVLTTDIGTGATAAEGSGCFLTLEESRIQTSALLTGCRDSSEAAHTPVETPPSPAEQPQEPVMTERRGQSPEQEAVDQVCPSPEPPELQQRLLSSIKKEPCDPELGVSQPTSSQEEEVLSSVKPEALTEVCTRLLSPEDHKDLIQVHLKGGGGPTEVLTTDIGTGATAAEGSGCFLTLEESRIQTSALLTGCRDSSEAAHTPVETPPSPAEQPQEPVMTERRGQSPEQEAVDQVCPSPEPPELQQRLLSSIKKEPCDPELGVSQPTSSQEEEVLSSVKPEALTEVCTRLLSPEDHKGDENMDYSTDSAESLDGFDEDHRAHAEPGDGGGRPSSVNPAKGGEMQTAGDPLSSKRLTGPVPSSLSRRGPLRPSTVPLTEDVQLLHQFLQRRSADAAEDLFNQETPRTYAELARVTLAQIILFNRHHAEDISHMTVESFMDRNKNSALRDIVYSLSQFEQKLAKHLSVVEIMHRQHRAALLLQPEVVSAAILLKDRRDKCQVHKDNPFLFGRPHCPANSFYWGEDCVRVFAQKCGAKNPESLTSRDLRKHIAAVSQVLGLESDELEELGGYLGLGVRTDRDFYRQREAAGELDRICRLIQGKERPAEANAARRKRNLPKLRWTREEEAAVMKYFGEHIRRGLNPPMSLCKECKDQEPVLEDRTVLNIKAFVRSRALMWRDRMSPEGQT